MTAASASAEQASTDPFRLVGTRLDGKYAVEAVVAEGGFAVVYRCAHTELQMTVALKVLKIPAHHAQEARGEFFRKFANEARTIARIDHEAIVRVLDFGSSIMPTGDLAPWMALEWLDGQTLERDLDERAKTDLAARSPAECFALLRPVIEAVALAHEEGIAHRDIKPGNLMIVTSRRGEVKLKLLDFGIAKVMTDDDRAPSPGQTSTQPHLQMFSLEYAAPEQLSGTRTGPWTDVHALSLVLTEMLTGEQPYEGDDSVELFSEALSRRRPTPGRFGLDVGPWEPVLQRALALRPADRYPDAGALLKALLAEVPTQAVWREDLSGPPAPSSDRPAPTPEPAAIAAPAPPPEPAPTPAVEPAIPESGRITELLPQPPLRAALDDEQDAEPVRLPINRMGWLGWAAVLVGLVSVVVAVIATQRPSPSRPPAPRPSAARPVAPPPPLPVPVPAPPPVPAAPAAVVPEAPPVAVPSVVAAPLPAVAPVVPAPPRTPSRRARPAGASGGRIPIE
jgi:serine/threonine protein kinase